MKAVRIEQWKKHHSYLVYNITMLNTLIQKERSWKKDSRPNTIRRAGVREAVNFPESNVDKCFESLDFSFNSENAPPGAAWINYTYN